MANCRCAILHHQPDGGKPYNWDNHLSTAAGSTKPWGRAPGLLARAGFSSWTGEMDSKAAKILGGFKVDPSFFVGLPIKGGTS